jgi:YesN/AraC family two-component response regulator
METSEMAKKFCGYSISSSPGSIVNSIFAINDSFEEAEAGLKERFFLGAGTITAGQNNTPRREIAYPRNLGDQLYQAILSGDKNTLYMIIGKFADTLGETSYEYTRIYLITMVIEILSLCLTNKLPVDANSFHVLIGELQKSETLQKARIILSEFCLSLSRQINTNPVEAPPLLVQNALTLATEKYQDPLFSINIAAESFNITPAYFNRIFKKYRRVSYSEFLNEYRMEMARRLLKETNKSITVIAAEIGISNATYFYTLFKKLYNITPQQYRNS